MSRCPYNMYLGKREAQSRGGAIIRKETAVIHVGWLRERRVWTSLWTVQCSCFHLHYGEVLFLSDSITLTA